MSTKNLARTVIEGGRSPYARAARRDANATGRSRARLKIAAILGDDWAMDDLAMPTPKRAFRFFDDKLGPPERWLTSQVGRPWDKVRADLFARFDTRTTAGRHIVFDHMLRWVKQTGLPCGCFAKFFVDRHGILRRPPRKARARHAGWRPLPLSDREIGRWLGGRLVGAQGDVLFWFTRTASGAYRQHERLDEEDLALWRSMPESFRKETTPPVLQTLRQNRN